MDWKGNKWLGIGAGAAILICIVIALAPFIKRGIENKKIRERGLKWMEQEKKWQEEGKWLEEERTRDLP